VATSRGVEYALRIGEQAVLAQIFGANISGQIQLINISVDLVDPDIAVTIE
jgi:tRNA(Ser,Leu) C12 N-acetylase TAN1